MSEFLSSAWLRELDDAARASGALASLGRERPLVVEQRVSTPRRGEIAYHVTIDEHGARVTEGRAAAPHVVLTTDLDTAWRLHQGTTNAQQAFGAGSLAIIGAADELLRRKDAVAALDDVFTAVRRTTTAPDHR